MKLGLKMTRAAAATYLPDSMAITLGEQFDALADPCDPVGFETPERLSFIFHEWLHYIDKVSTLHGLTAFSNAMHLWADLRQTSGPDGFSLGSESCAAERSVDIQQRLEYWKATRFPKITSFPNTGLHNLVLTKTDLVETPITGTELAASTVRCTVEVKGQGAATIVEIGTHEIIEGVAWMLEDRLLTSIGGISALPSPVPYLLVKNILLLWEPSLTSADINACLLRSLQDSDPPRILHDCMEAIPTVIEHGESVFEVMKKMSAEALQGNIAFEHQTIEALKRLVQFDEPMGRFVLETIAQIRRNLDHRRANPFLEIGIVDAIKTDRRAIEGAIRFFGRCSLLQKRSGSVHDIGRDYFFHLSPTSMEDLDAGRLKLLAAFRYMQIHIQNTAFISTAYLASTGGKCQCPLYTTCTLPHRKEHPIVCWESPWKAALVTDDSVQGCSYRAAVIATTAPRSEVSAPDKPPSLMP